MIASVNSLQGGKKRGSSPVHAQHLEGGAPCQVTSFPLAVKREDHETVVFSWVVWPSKEVRDAGNAKVMADPRMHPTADNMPFDGKRLIYGGFEVLMEV